MTPARWKEVVKAIRLDAGWMAICSVSLGGELADAVWKRHGVFYPFSLLLWGFGAVFWSFLTVGRLNQLSYAVKLEEAQTMKSAAHRVTAYIFCTALISLFFTVCVLAAKLFRWHYAVAAVGLGILAIAMIFATDREIRRLPRTLSHPSDEHVTPGV